MIYLTAEKGINPFIKLKMKAVRKKNMQRAVSRCMDRNEERKVMGIVDLKGCSVCHHN